MKQTGAKILLVLLLTGGVAVGWMVQERLNQPSASKKDKNKNNMVMPVEAAEIRRGPIILRRGFSGTLEARAIVPNPHSLLVPGQYVRVILQDTNLLEGLFLPQAAVQADQQGSFVLVVDAGSTVVRRNVELGNRLDDMVRVKRGVEEGDRVIVRGLQQVRPGMPVKAQNLPAAPAEG